jgi:hypothetical protein
VKKTCNSVRIWNRVERLLRRTQQSVEFTSNDGVTLVSFQSGPVHNPLANFVVVDEPGSLQAPAANMEA